MLWNINGGEFVLSRHEIEFHNKNISCLLFVFKRIKIVFNQRLKGDHPVFKQFDTKSIGFQF